MAPKGSAEVIDLCGSDDDEPAGSSSTRQDGRPIANNSRKSPVLFVPKSGKTGLSGLSKGFKEQTAPKPGNRTIARVVGRGRPSNQPPTSMMDQNRNATKAKLLSNIANSSIANRVEKHKGDSKLHSFTPRKELEVLSDDTDEDLPDPSTFMTPRGDLRKNPITGAIERNRDKTIANSTGSMGARGTKRSLDDGSSAGVLTAAKRQKLDVRNGESRSSSTSGSGSRSGGPKSLDTLASRRDLSKVPPRKSATSQPVDVTAPVADGNRSTGVVIPLSDDDDDGRNSESEVRAPSVDSSALPAKKSRNDATSGTPTPLTSLRKRLLKTPNEGSSTHHDIPSDTDEGHHEFTKRSRGTQGANSGDRGGAKPSQGQSNQSQLVPSRKSSSLAKQPTDLEPVGAKDRPLSARRETPTAAKRRRLENSGLNRQSSAAAASEPAKASKSGPSLGSLDSRSEKVREPEVEKEEPEKVSTIRDKSSVTLELQTTKVRRSNRASQLPSEQIDGLHPKSVGNTAITPGRSADTTSARDSAPSREGHTTDKAELPNERSDASDFDQGYASLDSTSQANADELANNAQPQPNSETSERGAKPDSTTQQAKVHTEAGPQTTDNTQRVAGDTQEAVESPREEGDGRLRQERTSPTHFGESPKASGKEPSGTGRSISDKAVDNSTPLASEKTKHRGLEAKLPGQPKQPDGPPLGSVAHDPANLPKHVQEDSDSPFDKVAPITRHDIGTAAESNMYADAEREEEEHAPTTPQVCASSHSQTALSALGLSKQVELVLGRQLEELRGDNEYWNQVWLHRARLSSSKPKAKIVGPSRADLTAPEAEEPYSFAALKPLQLCPPEKTMAVNQMTKFTVEKMATPGVKPTKTPLAVPITIIKPSKDMPEYAHAVGIRGNFLAPNVTNIHSWPYFGDGFDFDEAEGLKEQYNMDIRPRPTKLLRLVQAQKLEEYAEGALRELSLTWDDVLRFLLEAGPVVGSDPDAEQALEHRYVSCSEDFSRKNQRTALVLSSLNPSTPERLAKAAVVCEIFSKMAWISLWHVARRRLFTKLPSETDDGKSDMLGQMTCRICMRFDCPYHGELAENGDSDDEASEDDSAVMTDVINPPKVNYRTRVAFPPKPLDAPSSPETDPSHRKDRRTLQYWQHNFVNKADERGPFYPCHHPGVSCEDAECSCHENGLPCEKTCACPTDCQRKFQGCTCSSEKARKGLRLVCFEDERCICFSLGRECDPDLCGACGVCEVLDPVNRYSDDVPNGKCRNACIQRGLPKRTLLGESGIHGFGLYAGEDIKQHEFVGEYKGEVITKEEAERRGAVYEFQRLSYLFSLNAAQEIDSTYFGNKIRFINHAGYGKFNLYPRIFLVNTVHRIALYAEKPIKKGEELLFDYGPKFPDEQLGGTTAAPHVRNAALVRHDFEDVHLDRDGLGNKRAMKAVKPRGRPRKSDVSSATGTPKKRGGARPGAGRKSRKTAPQPVEGEEDEDEEEEHVVQPDYSADARLAAFNISDDVPEDAMEVDIEAGAEDDDVFEPEESAEEASEESEEDAMAGFNEEVLDRSARKARARRPGPRRGRGSRRGGL